MMEKIGQRAGDTVLNILMIVVLGLFCSCVVARACESFEECVEESKAQASYWCSDENYENGHKSYTTKGCVHYAGAPLTESNRIYALNKAIAYKLDEISKKLEPSDSIKRAASQNDMEIWVDCQRGFIKDKTFCDEISKKLGPSK